MIIGLLAAYSFTLPAYGVVTILSEHYHVSGATPLYSPETAYHNTGPNPISGDDSFSASSQAWRFGAKAETVTDDGWARATSTFVFTVDQPILTIKFTGYLWARAFPDISGGISYLLTENLTNNTIESQSWSLSDDDEIGGEMGGGAWERTIEEFRIYNLIAGNEYKLLLAAEVTNADGSYASLETVLAPEPSSILLLGLGASCRLFHRRRCQK